MNFFTKLIIAWAARRVRQAIEEYFDDVQWTDDDAKELKNFLETDAGKKFSKLAATNNIRCLSKIIKAGKDETIAIKAEAKAWLGVKSMIDMLSMPRKPKANEVLAQDKLDEIFANIVSSSSRVSSSAIFRRS